MISGGIHDKINLMQHNASRQILKFCSESAKSIKELSIELGIPIAKCYRLVLEMEDVGLLYKCDKIRSRGKEFCLYKSNKDLEFFTIDDTEIKIDLTPGNNFDQEFHKRCSSVDV